MKKPSNKHIIAAIIVIILFIGIVGGIELIKNNNYKKNREYNTAEIERLLAEARKLKSLEIEELKISYISSNYVDLNITVKNTGSTDINYVKIDIFLIDKEGNIIGSDWTNDSSRILPSAKQTITKMIKRGEWTQVSAKVRSAR